MEKIQKVNEENNIQEFEINQLVVNVHNKIANWHNDDPNNLSLKFLSLDIVEEIAGAVFKHLGLEYNQALKLDDEAREKLKQSKQNLNSDKKQSELSDEELIKEIERRKLNNRL